MDWTMWLEWFLKGLVMCLILLGGFAYLTLYERRALARIQTRVGPNRAGPQGILQPIADAVKLIFKEELTPASVYKTVFILAPVITVVPSLVIAAVIPLGGTFMLGGREIALSVADLNVGVLYLTAIASVAVYGIVLAGWSSNNKYAMLGGVRSAAQMISYEISLGLCFVLAVILSALGNPEGGSMNLREIVDAQRGMWFAVYQPLGAVIFFFVTLAEVNRAPFDMPEAEQELTAGYHAEYSGMKFALFFMAEYQKMIVVSLIGITLFFGGYRELWFMTDWFGGALSVDKHWFLGPVYLFIKTFIFLFFMIWVRATWPRIRYDRLMALGWKIFLPLCLALVFITAVGILLVDFTGSRVWIWGVPVLSILCGAAVSAFIYRDLRRKSHGRI
ncbi:MAG: NADH-quinone oxidoreductase subunit NuoH [Anaerolineales bacterium]|nr:NADH-quinone oxidoreductase subunit NuoH [Anaerolineales bacterium]